MGVKTKNKLPDNLVAKALEDGDGVADYEENVEGFGVHEVMIYTPSQRVYLNEIAGLRQAQPPNAFQMKITELRQAQPLQTGNPA